MQAQKLSTTVFTVLADGSAVLLNLETLHYFSLNRTAAALWQEIEQTDTADLQKLALRACEEFEVEQPSALKEISGFLQQLAQMGLVRIL